MHLSARTDSAMDPLITRLCLSTGPIQRASIGPKCGIGQGMGVIPLIYPAALLGGFVAAWAADESWQNFGLSFDATPPAPTPRGTPPGPSVSQLQQSHESGSTVTPGFDPSTMHERTTQQRRARQEGFQQGTKFGGSVAGGNPPPPSTNEPNYLLYIGLGLGGLALLTATR